MHCLWRRGRPYNVSSQGILDIHVKYLAVYVCLLFVVDADLLRQLGVILDRCRRVDVRPGDIVLLLRALRLEGSGRYRLMEALSLSEARVKSLLKHLKSLGYVRAAGKAHVLTDRGVCLVDSITRMVIGEGEIETPYRLGGSEYYIHVRGLGGRVRSGLEERDQAIIAGGTGAVTLVYSGGGLVFPDSGARLSDISPELNEELVGRERFEEGDVVIIVGANDSKAARSIAYTVLISLLMRDADG